MTKMFKIALPDGSVREMPEGSTPADVAAAIGPGLAKAALAARVDGEVRDINRPFEGDAELALITVARREGRARAGPPRLRPCPRRGGAEPLSRAPRSPSARRPTTASITTSRRRPERGPFTDEDLPAIEEEMRRIIAADEPLVREVWTRERRPRTSSRSRARAFKAEWVMELPEGEPITMYRSGQGDDAWIDLCRGPHLASTGKLDPQAFKLTRVSGAYWRGDQKNPMLCAHLRHRLAQQEAARRASRPARGSGQARPSQDRPGDGPVPPPGRSAGLASSGTPRASSSGAQLEAYMRRRLDAAGYRRGQDPAADGRAPVGADRATGASIARTCSSSPTRSRRPRTTRRSCRATPT